MLYLSVLTIYHHHHHHHHLMVMMIITTSLVNVVQSVGGLRQTKITCCLLPSSLPGPPRIIAIIITVVINIISNIKEGGSTTF